MPNINVRFRALTDSRRNKEIVNEKRVRSAVVKFMRSYLNDVKKEVWVYPPPPPNSKYERTGRLHESWKVDVKDTSHSITGYITNDAVDDRGRHYSSYVQGQWQVWYHAQTGWKVLYDYVERATFRRDLQQVINDAMEK